MNSTTLKVYFDGLCPLCSREIDYYRTKNGASAIGWIDITQPGFDAVSEGLDPALVHRYFHVKDQSGKVTSGIDAFIEIWSRIPALKLWKTASSLPGARPVMKLGYALFARVRPWLPRRRRNSCSDEACALRD